MLTGERVRLRQLTQDDAEAHWRWNHDDEVMRWFSTAFPIPLAKFTEGYAERRVMSYENAAFGIETLADERLIGLVMLGDTSHENGDAELDIYIGEKDCWGRGYGTDALRLMCRFGFDRMGLRRIHLWVADENLGAIGAYKKVGFVEEGRARKTFRSKGVWHDMVLMGLLEDELIES